MLSDYINELYRYRELVLVWGLREVRVRYKQSLLGVMWAILQPLVMMIVFTLVFSRFAKVPTDGIPYPLFSYTALLPWTLLATAISFGVPSLVNNLNLVVKTYFPREILPIGAVGASFFDFMVASSVFAVLLLYYRIELTWMTLWLPLVLILQLVLILGIAFAGSALLVLYRDLRFIVPLGLQIWLYLTPVIYPITIIPEQYLTLYMLNPMAGIITAYRQIILFGQQPNLMYLGIAGLEAILIFLFGYMMFKKLEISFADII
ncbi:MAG: ABC transporter permease [Chloroflexota bacterium]